MAARRDRPDYYSRKARQEQFASRAVYKLADIDRQHRLLQPGQRVLDLGCAPGSWLQYVSSRVGPQGLVVGVDQHPLPNPPGPPIVFRQADITSLPPEDLHHLSAAFDVVLSDLAPATSGIKDVDHQRSLNLARRAWEFAERLLAAGGHFLVKVFAGPDFSAFVAAIKPHFQKVVLIKPTASRKESREIYVLGYQKKAKPQIKS